MFPESFELLHDLCLTVGLCDLELGLNSLLQLSDGLLVTQTHLLGVLLLRGREDVVTGGGISDRAEGNPIIRSIKSLVDFHRDVADPIKTTRQQIRVRRSAILPDHLGTHMVLQLLEHLAHVLVPVLLGGAQLVLDGLAQLVRLCVQLFAHALHVIQLRGGNGLQ